MIINDCLKDGDILIKSISIEDCNETYLGWLLDCDINRFLETRWNNQNIGTIREFVNMQIKSLDSYLFSINIYNNDKYKHIGNIKIGPINFHYKCCDISYFIGDKSYHGKGIASRAIRLVSDYGFKKIGLHRIQASLFEENIASKKALEKAGFVYEGMYHDKGISPTTNNYCNLLIYYKLDSML